MVQLIPPAAIPIAALTLLVHIDYIFGTDLFLLAVLLDSTVEEVVLY
jgi:hypothetical protein